MAQNGPAERRKFVQDQEGTFSIEGWFNAHGKSLAEPPAAASSLVTSSATNSVLAQDESFAGLEITPGTEIDPYNWSNTFLKAYREFELLEQFATNIQNDFVARKLATMEDQLMAARAEADLLPVPKLRIRLEELQATHMYSNNRPEREDLAGQLSMLRLNICSQVLVRLALAEFHNKIGDRLAAQNFLRDAEQRAAELQETNGELECVDYLMKVRAEVLCD